MKKFVLLPANLFFTYLIAITLFTSCGNKNIEEVDPLYAVAKIEAFNLDPSYNADLDGLVTGKISGNNIVLSVPYKVSLNALVASFKFTGASVKVENADQVSNITKNDFTSQVKYTVTAKSGKKTDYTVIITKDPARIPKIYINTEGNAAVTSKDQYVKMVIRVEDIDKLYSNNITSSASARIKGRGNSTWNMPKKPYRINLDTKTSLLGMSVDKDWALLANYLDKTLLRNITAFEISRIAGLKWTPSSVSVDFYLNGAYQGVYAFTEHVKVADNRLNMPLVGASDNSGEALTGGYLMELDFHYDEPHKFKTNLKRLPIMFKDPDAPTPQQFNYVKDLYNTAENTLYSANFKDPQNGYRKYLDVESFVNYFIVQELAKNVDGNMRGSCYMAIRRGGKIEMPLVWDFDLAFGNADHITWEQGASSSEWDGWFIKTNAPWYDRLFEDEYFVQLVKQRWSTVKSQLDKLPVFIRDKATMLEEPQKRNFSPVSSGGAGWSIAKSEWNTNKIRGSYAAEVNYLISFVEKRLHWLDVNINNL